MSLADHASGVEAAGAAPVVVECRDVWKIFGRDPQGALAAIRSDRLDKEAALARFGAVIGVAGASFTVRRGEIFCIMGLSGSGKSTLVRHVNGLVAPTAGQVLIDGEDIARKPAAELRALRAAKIGMVFQSFALLPHRTVLGNAAFGLELRGVPRAERERIAMAVLAEVRLAEWAHRSIAELSGGMQQRVGLARALAGDPEILLMDEPFGALDPLIRRQLQDQFLDLSRRLGKTTVFITHDLEEAMRLGDRIAIMRDGVIVQCGRPAEIVRAPADAYVAEFVGQVSRLKLLRARDVMRRIAPGEAVGAGWPRVGPDTDLEALAARAADSAHSLVVEGPGGAILGLIDARAVLRGLAGGGDGGGEHA